MAGAQLNAERLMTGKSGQSSPIAAAALQSRPKACSVSSAAGRLSSVPKCECVTPSAFSRARSTELSRPVMYGANRLAVTISIGAAFYPQHALQFAGLYTSADEATSRAKQKGRSGFVLQGEGGELSLEECLALDVLKVPSGLS